MGSESHTSYFVVGTCDSAQGIIRALETEKVSVKIFNTDEICSTKKDGVDGDFKVHIFFPPL